MSIFARKPHETKCDVVDRLPKALRELVHEYGLAIIQSFHDSGVREPKVIKRLVAIARLGAREPGNRHPGNHSRLTHLDDWLVSSGSHLCARQVVRVIREGGYTVLPMTGPTLEMTLASMATVSNGLVKCTKEEKHQRRLSAAMMAGDCALWGDK